MNEILNKIEKICRICLLEQPLMYSLLHTPDLTNVAQMLMTCTTVKVQLNDNLPQLICSSCLDRLESAYVFKLECEQNDKTLNKLISENEETCDKKNEIFIPFLIGDEQQDLSGIDPLTFVKTEINELETSNKNNKEPENIQFVSETSNDFSETKNETSETNKKIKHKRIKNVDQGYECQTCKKSFNEHRNYWKHRELYHMYFSCYVCWKQFTNLETLEKHKCEENKIYICEQELCDKEFSDFRLFLFHKKSDHQIENYLQCSDCHEQFSCHRRWDQHIQRHLSNPYKCEACEEKFRTENELNTHVSIHPAYWKCSECGITCADKHHFDKHKKAHERSVTCEECGKKWKRMADLKRHIACVHSDAPKPKKIYNYKRVLCTICGKTLARPYQLKLHLQQHNGEKPYACDFENCDYRTVQKTHLRIHKRSHTHERPYICDICGKRFNTSSYLVIHKRYHNNDRPYKCSYAPCEKGFTNSRDLRTHEKSHTGIKDYHCTVCDNSFTTLHYFKVHSKKHENQYNQEFTHASTSDVVI